MAEGPGAATAHQGAITPIIVKWVTGTSQLELDPRRLQGPGVADLKSAIAESTGIEAERQRLVARGRVLLDCENLDAVGLASGGRVFLALLPPPPSADEMLAEPPEAEPLAELAGAEEPMQRGGFHVVVRALDADSELRVFTTPQGTVEQLKRDILIRLGHSPSVELQEVCRWNFVCDGQLLGHEGSVADHGLQPDARVIVVPPLDKTSRSSRWPKWHQLPGVCARRTMRSVRSLAGLPAAILQWLAGVWMDPWSLVRPTLNEGQGRGRRVHLLRMHPRTLRYAPGQNPHGEDLTMLLSQGLLGSAG